MSHLLRRADEASLRAVDWLAAQVWDRVGAGKVITARLLIFSIMFFDILDRVKISNFIVPIIMCLVILFCQIGIEFVAKMQGPERFAAYCEIAFRYNWVRYMSLAIILYGLALRSIDHNWLDSLSDLTYTCYWYALSARWPQRPRERRRDVRSRDLAWST